MIILIVRRNQLDPILIIFFLHPRIFFVSAMDALDEEVYDRYKWSVSHDFQEAFL